MGLNCTTQHAPRHASWLVCCAQCNVQYATCTLQLGGWNARTAQCACKVHNERTRVCGCPASCDLHHASPHRASATARNIPALCKNARCSRAFMQRACTCMRDATPANHANKARCPRRAANASCGNTMHAASCIAHPTSILVPPPYSCQRTAASRMEVGSTTKHHTTHVYVYGYV